jgi:hypothetical protein
LKLPRYTRTKIRAYLENARKLIMMPSSRFG